MSTRVLSEKIVKTKKDHTCCACGRTFPAGSVMKYQANIYYGDFGSIYVCDTCQQLMVEAQGYLYDDFELVYSEYCVLEALTMLDHKTPEEWLGAIRMQSNEVCKEAKS